MFKEMSSMTVKDVELGGLVLLHNRLCRLKNKLYAGFGMYWLEGEDVAYPTRRYRECLGGEDEFLDAFSAKKR